MWSLSLSHFCCCQYPFCRMKLWYLFMYSRSGEMIHTGTHIKLRHYYYRCLAKALCTENLGCMAHGGSRLGWNCKDEVHWYSICMLQLVCFLHHMNAMPCKISPPLTFSNAECINTKIATMTKLRPFLKVMLMYNLLHCCCLNCCDKFELRVFLLVEVWECCIETSSAEEGFFSSSALHKCHKTRGTCWGHWYKAHTFESQFKNSPNVKMSALFMVHTLSESCTTVQKRVLSLLSSSRPNAHGHECKLPTFKVLERLLCFGWGALYCFVNERNNGQRPGRGAVVSFIATHHWT